MSFRRGRAGMKAPVPFCCGLLTVTWARDAILSSVNLVKVFC